MPAGRIDPDDFLEKIIKGLLPIWGPFYALFYIIRLMWHELRGSREQEESDDDFFT
ncbi:hypothetical protein IH781_00835 [Patescibacteria group bacterium]|nr:hypothetical protein [Patescibacteria group bacterium]